MISLDTNLLFASLEESHRDNDAARRYVLSLSDREDVGVSELVLVELYGLFRNPAICRAPLTPRAAVDLCDSFRSHPFWRLFGFPSDSVSLHRKLWEHAGAPGFGRRQIYDLRLGLSLVQQGVTEFATANVKHFQGLGFERVFNPLAASSHRPA